MTETPVLDVSGLRDEFPTSRGLVRAVAGHRVACHLYPAPSLEEVQT